MSEQTEHDEPDDVECHRFHTPDLPQERAEAARRKRQQSDDEAAGPGAGDS
jgi:hypothetical protein